MRHYRSDSPETAARIIAACLLCDGHVGFEELQALDRCGIEQRLHINRGQLLGIMRELCEELMSTPCLNWNDSCRPDPEMVLHLAQDVRDLRLREEIIALCEAGAYPDGHRSENCIVFIQMLRDAWKEPSGYELARSRDALESARM
ncbi:TerB family tellurite resistance protein [Paraburkholderia rhizosphaerae]|uniref:Tellurite resistance protein TerB n=1 Tax=Paraburkholderia rhizosphaerae TaxID=480658 RepID=A0A4R8LWC7_9BURK|nr:TerB family tellurite resistance protein [Paraburkholderia rhizosphaerae]TDY52214.1 hypothetical protein BX592_10598 [Paraburkholderia rhizosphaerae]